MKNKNINVVTWIPWTSFVDDYHKKRKTRQKIAIISVGLALVALGLCYFMN